MGGQPCCLQDKHGQSGQNIGRKQGIGSAGQDLAGTGWGFGAPAPAWLAPGSEWGLGLSTGAELMTLFPIFTPGAQSSANTLRNSFNLKMVGWSSFWPDGNMFLHRKMGLAK